MWMQLGFREAAIDSSLYIQKRMLGELVIINPQSDQIESTKVFPRRQLVRAQGHPDVDRVTSLYVGTVQWRDPWTGVKRSLFAYGIVPYAPAIDVSGVSESVGPLLETDTCLFDTKSRSEFATVLKTLAAGQPVEAEVNGRRVNVVGTTTIGASFQVDGNLVTSDANFLRLFPQRAPASIDVGVIRLRPGADARRVKVELQKIYGANLLVLTRDEYVERDRAFFLNTRPINFIFGMGTAVGFLVGFAIVYQVLFTDVNNHLPRYADT